jgi:hypothetical protein
MRKFAILGASALVLALGVAQASAANSRTLDYTNGYFTLNPILQSQAAQSRDGLNGFVARAPDSNWQAPSETVAPPVRYTH